MFLTRQLLANCTFRITASSDKKQTVLLELRNFPLYIFNTYAISLQVQSALLIIETNVRCSAAAEELCTSLRSLMLRMIEGNGETLICSRGNKRATSNTPNWKHKSLVAALLSEVEVPVCALQSDIHWCVKQHQNSHVQKKIIIIHGALATPIHGCQVFSTITPCFQLFMTTSHIRTAV